MQNDAPKPTPMGKQKLYKIKENSDSNYKIKLTYCSDKLIIEIEQEDYFPQLNYSSTFILEEIQKNDKWFRLFDTFDESSDTIDGLFEEKKVNIIKQENNINLILIHSEKNINDSIFQIEKKQEEKEDDIIPKLMESHNDLRKRVKLLEQNNKEMKELIDKIMSIPDINKYISKASKNFLDGIIKKEEDKNLIFSWINPNKEKVSAKLIYSAQNDGDDPSIFHKLCDNIGFPTLVIVESTEGKIFGGYTRQSWAGSCYKKDPDAFIFSLDERQKAELILKDYDIYCNPTYGPTFGGGHDIYICSGCLKVKRSYIRSHSYKFKNNELNSFQIKDEPFFKLNVNSYFICKDVEVHAIIEN